MVANAKLRLAILEAETLRNNIRKEFSAAITNRDVLTYNQLVNDLRDAEDLVTFAEQAEDFDDEYQNATELYVRTKLKNRK